jgi:hypothetical protein
MPLSLRVLNLGDDCRGARFGAASPTMIRKLATIAGIFAILVLGATSANAKGGGHAGGHGGHFSGHSPGAGYPYDRTAQPGSRYRCQPGVCFND